VARRGELADSSAILETRGRLRSHIQRYLHLPMFIGEKEVFDRVSVLLPEVDSAVNCVLEDVPAGRAGAAHDIVRNELRSAVDAASDALAESVNFDATQSERLAKAIQVTQ